VGFPLGGFPVPQGRYYCSVGDNNSFGRAFIEASVRSMLAMGLNIAGINAEVAPG
jgi:glutamine synthetase